MNMNICAAEQHVPEVKRYTNSKVKGNWHEITFQLFLSQDDRKMYTTVYSG